MSYFLKCKMCGGDLRIISGLNIAECEYCGTRQSVPKTPDERKTSYFNRANEARRANEFDKAIGIYESIVAEYPDEAEAYWGLCLCKFGIEYVDDPKTGRKIPTCHRTAYDSIFEDKDYNSAISHGDTDQIRIFKQEATVIDKIQKSILNSVNLENPYDVFICYKETDERTGQRTQESVIGQELYENLCSREIRTFFARVSLEEVLGEEYEPHIFAALNSARIMLVLGSSNSNYNAPWVRNEWSRYLELARKDKAHSIIPCFINMDPYDLPNEFSSLQAQDLGKVGAIQDIIRGIEKILGKTQFKPNNQTSRESVSSSSIDAVYERGKISLRNGEWKKAQSYFDEVLNKDPRNADVYAYLLMIENKCRSLEELAQLDIPIKNSSNYKNALEFADDDFVKKLRKISATIDRRYSLIKKRKKRIILITAIIIALLAGAGLAVFVWIKTTPQRIYKKASKLIDDEDYKAAYELINNNKNIGGLTELYEKSLLGYAKASIEQGNYDFAYGLLDEVNSSEEKNRLISSVNCTIELKNIEESNFGDVITFGSYPQGDVNGKKSDPIEWYVIEKDFSKALLLSKNTLEYAKGHNGNYLKTMENAYECLNNTFYNKAFSEEERKHLEATSRRVSYSKAFDKPVFVISEDEVKDLSESIITAKTTDYAANKGAIRAENLQNAGCWLLDYYQKSAGGRSGGLIKYVASYGDIRQTEQIDVGLRPAICVSFSGETNDEAERESTTEGIDIGSSMTMGKYEQDSNSSNGEEDIEWIVLDKDVDSILVISKYILDCKEFDTQNDSTSWEQSSLRKWMNDDFINTSFSEEERGLIKEINLWNRSQNSSDDRVFVLNEEEIQTYLKPNTNRQCKATAFSISNGVDVDENGNGIYWLRNKVVYNMQVAVNKDGSITDRQKTTDKSTGVRPAMWVKVEKK